MRIGKRALPVLAGFIMAAFTCFAPGALAQEGDPLFDLYEKGYMLHDSNGDSLIDRVDLRLVLPDDPSEAEIIAAANIAARIGYESTALDPAISCSLSRCRGLSDVPVILVGDAAAFGLDLPAARRSPSQGSVLRVQDDRFPQGAVLVTGYDATGLLSAAEYLSAIYPLIDPSDDRRWSGVRSQFDTLAEEDSVALESVSLRELAVTEGRTGITRAQIRIGMADAAGLERLTDRLGEEDRLDRWKQVLLGSALYRADLELFFDGSSETVTLTADRVQGEHGRGEPEGSGNPSFNLHQFYTVDGIYRDTNRDRVADDLNAWISYRGTGSAHALIRLSARIGLETAGVRLPLVYPGDTEHPESRGFPILLHTDAPSASPLSGSRRLMESSLEPGEGVVEFVEEGFGDRNGVVIYGGDEIGQSAAVDYLAGRIPYQWDHGKGEWRLEDTQTDVRRFLQGVEGSGQTAAGVEKLRTWLRRMSADPESVSVRLFAEETPEGLSGFLQGMVSERFPDAAAEISVRNTGFGVGDTIFTEQVEFPWEVDRFWSLYESELAPAIGPGSEGLIRLRVSESPEMRRKIAGQIRTRLSEAGVPWGRVEVQVLAAYKQGFSWIEDVIIPQLEGEEAESVEVTYRHLRDSEEIRWQAAASATRWLQEIYPIDGVLNRRLGIADSLIRFTPTWTGDDTYTLEARDSTGQTLLRDTFEPKYVVRPFFDQFPEYDSVRVTTGWVEAEIDGETLLDERIPTDIELFWDHLQSTTYRKMVNYVLDIQEGLPRSSLAPYFDEFRLDVTLSEPDYQLGFLHEQISSTEALHEDIYFETLLLFDLIGNRYGVGGLSYPGRILPWIRPPEPGEPGRARISLTGKQEARPLIELRWHEDGEIMEKRYELPNTPVEDPSLRAVRVRDGLEGVDRLWFDVPVDSLSNPFEELQQRGSETYIDRTFISAERLEGMAGALGDMQEEGMFPEVLSYDRVGSIGLRFTMEDSIPQRDPVVMQQSGRPRATYPPPLPAVDFVYEGQNLVQWETPISPDENNRIMARLNTFNNIEVYHAATSMLGNEVFAMDLLPPVEAPWRSQAKLNALKPTLFISGRQHANEFSSTSHMLKLAEKVATDPEYRRYLDRINLVLHPMTNPDGAQLAVDLHQVNPNHMHHAGYLGPLGVDIPRDQNNRDPRYEVAKVRREIHETWLPDIFINMHGYPPHEWVQYFAGYSAWMMGRERGTNSNNYWIPRGYFLTGFSWFDHDEAPFNRQLSFALLDSITTGVTGVPEMRRVNREMQRRYRKYRSHEEGYGEFYYNGVWVNAPLEGRDRTGSGFSDPRVTYFTLTSEAPDEPARGDWMVMNAEAGLAHSTAILNYLYHGLSGESITEKLEGGRMHRSRYRIKPVLPPALHEKREQERE